MIRIAFLLAILLSCAQALAQVPVSEVTPPPAPLPGEPPPWSGTLPAPPQFPSPPPWPLPPPAPESPPPALESPPAPETPPPAPEPSPLPAPAALPPAVAGEISTPSRTSWSLQLESAQGVAPGKFQNTLLGGHIDYGFSSRMSLGGYLAIANLKGKDKRVSALMPCALLTYEKPRGPGGSVSFPLQFATGYLSRNGPVARLAAGLAWAVGRRTDLVGGLATMAWVTRDEMLVSVDLVFEVRFRAGE